MKNVFALLAVMLFAVVSFGQEISNDTLLPARQVWTAPVYVASWTFQYTGDSLPKYNDLMSARLFWRRGVTGATCWDTTPAIRFRQRGIDTLNNRKGYTVRMTIELLPR